MNLKRSFTPLETMKRHKRRLVSLTGFTLTELIISIIVIGISVISVTLMYQESLRGSLNTRILTTATALAEEKMEEVLRLGYSGIADLGLSSFPAPFGDYRFQVTVHYVAASDLNTSIDPQQAEYKNVEVQITHDRISATTVNSLLTNY